MIVVVEPDGTIAAGLRSALGGAPQIVDTVDRLRPMLDEVTVAVFGPSTDGRAAFDLASSMRISRPSFGVVLVRHRVDTALLSDALRAGVREVVAESEVDALAEAVDRVRNLSFALRDAAGAVAEDDGSGGGVLVSVFAAKGGCGKTTLATNLAAALADKGRREVCLVDLDLAFGDVAIALQLFPAHTLADAVPLAARLDHAAISQLLTPHSPGLSTLVAPVEPGTAETVPADLVGHLLQSLKQMFEFVVVDTPPAFTDHVLAAFDESDAIALLATLDIPALKNLKVTLETLELLNYPHERLRIVLNRADSKVGLSVGEVQRSLNAPISLQVPSSRSVPASINRGVPIVLDEPSHPVSVAIRQFAERQLAPLASPRSKAAAVPSSLRQDRRGLLRRKAKHT